MPYSPEYIEYIIERMVHLIVVFTHVCCFFIMLHYAVKLRIALTNFFTSLQLCDISADIDAIAIVFNLTFYLLLKKRSNNFILSSLNSTLRLEKVVLDARVHNKQKRFK